MFICFVFLISRLSEKFEETVNRKRTNNKREKSKNNELQKTTQKTKAKRIPLKTWGERVGSSCSISGTRRVTLLTNQVTSHHCGKERIVITKNGTYSSSFVTQISRTG